MVEGVVEVTDSSFDADVLKAEKPVVVDFWASWCGPCKAMEPVFADLAKTYQGKVIFAKCNVDDNPMTPGKYGIRAIPTLIFFKNGQAANQLTGITTKTKLDGMIQAIL